MADIDVEEKNPIWPWILAAVVIAIILLIIFIGDDEPVEPEIEDDPVGMIESPPTYDTKPDIPTIG